MNNKIFEEAIVTANRGSTECLEQAESILLAYLEKNPKDTLGWLLLIRIECNGVLYDHERIIEYATNILSYDPNNPYAILFLAYVHYYLLGHIDNSTYKRLCHAKSGDLEVLAMIEVAKAHFFENIDKEKYRQSLEKSIEYSQHQQVNFSMLAQYYLEIGDYGQALPLFKRGIENVKGVDNPYNPTSIEGFFDEIYKGIDISQKSYAELTGIIAKLEAHLK